MKKRSKFLIILILVLTIGGVGAYFLLRPTTELLSIRNDNELYSFYEQKNYSNYSDNILLRILTFPFSTRLNRYNSCPECDYEVYNKTIPAIEDEMSATSLDDATSGSSGGSSREFSTTNIQVENVDEADIIKTDGDYTYSISDSDVIISDLKDTSNPTIASRIESTDESVPEDLILSGDTLTIIGTEYVGSGYGPLYNRYDYYSRYYNEKNTTVRIYDISNHENPRLEKSYKLYEPYYTSRRIDDKLYVISSGHLRKGEKDNTVNRGYYEDHVEKEFAANSVRYLNDVRTNYLTLVSVVDLSNLDGNITVNPFLIDISNAYVSENAFYLVDERSSYYAYERNSLSEEIQDIFGFGGLIGYFTRKAERYNHYYDCKTNIFKFDIAKSGDISYSSKASVTGRTINQYSLDEKDGHLRIALYTDEGSYVSIFDEKMNQIGVSGKLAKGERMYASRFLGDKAYLVTYKNTDPLFVIDLADEKNPKVLGELKIPGYSVYLHPYDENHLIGIGVDTTEETSKDINGRVLWTRAYITGMKLALFDVSDFKNPKEISKLHIGDAYTSSAILTNPKALLFSKEKELLAIPVNNYESEFSIEISEYDDLSDLVSYFYDYDDYYVDEGYLVYNINLEDGITQRGEIIHEDSYLVRGLYIDDDLITISENTLKVNLLQDLSQKAELDLTKE